jgi:transposase
MAIVSSLPVLNNLPAWQLLLHCEAFLQPPWHDHHPTRLAIAADLPDDCLRLARTIDRLVDRLCLAKLVASFAGKGSTPHRPDLMLKAVLFFTQRGLHRPAAWTRQSCENRVVQWLLRGCRPSRARWYAFRLRLLPFIDELNAQFLALCQQEGLLGDLLPIVDGSFVAANSSRHKLVNQPTLQRRLTQLEQAIAADEAATSSSLVEAAGRDVAPLAAALPLPEASGAEPGGSKGVLVPQQPLSTRASTAESAVAEPACVEAQTAPPEASGQTPDTPRLFGNSWNLAPTAAARLAAARQAAGQQASPAAAAAPSQPVQARATPPTAAESDATGAKAQTKAATQTTSQQGTDAIVPAAKGATEGSVSPTRPGTSQEPGSGKAAGPVQTPGWLAKSPRGRKDQHKRYRKAAEELGKRLQHNSKRRKEDRKAVDKVMISLGDAQAVLGLDKEKVYRPLYNLQWASDLNTDFCLGYGVYCTTQDSETLLAMLERVEYFTGKKVKRAMTDGGYVTGANLRKLERKQIELIAPSPDSEKDQEKGKGKKEDKKIPKSKFTWDREKEVYICPQGQELKYVRTQTKVRAGVQEKHQQYRCAAEKCRNCPRQKECTSSSATGRMVVRNEYEEERQRHKERMEAEQAKKTYAKRKEQIERQIADSKEHRNLRRLSMRGKEGARLQMGLVALAHNMVVFDKLHSQRQAGQQPGQPGELPCCPPSKPLAKEQPGQQSPCQPLELLASLPDPPGRNPCPLSLSL